MNKDKITVAHTMYIIYCYVFMKCNINNYKMFYVV